MVALSLVLVALSALHFPLAEAAADSPAQIRLEGLGLKPVGGDELKLFGFRVYRATLWAPEGRLQPDRTIAFNLHYRREFSREELVDITVTAWQKVGLGTQTQRRIWAEQLHRIWQDVARGDMLTAVVIPGGETRFYNASKLLGHIDDKEFGPAFLGIWLDERTLLPELRSALLGLERTS